MKTENKYCCRCHRTTKFQVQEIAYMCTSCGLVVEKQEKSEERSLIGDPFRSYRTRFAT